MPLCVEPMKGHCHTPSLDLGPRIARASGLRDHAAAAGIFPWTRHDMAHLSRCIPVPLF